MELPSLQEFLKAEKLGRVSAHRQNGLVGFKYTNETIYSQDWDIVTLNARGIVFNEKTGEVVARPFKKFFNYQEFFDGEGNHSHLYDILPEEWKPNITGHARYLEKADGSLGIVFYNPITKKWQVKTGGSFESEQAIWGQKWFDEHLSHLCFNTSQTYLYEIISNEDIHPIHYDLEGLVLLSIIDNATGEELPWDIIKVSAEEFGVRVVQSYEFSDFNAAVEWAKKLPKTQEGLVITFDNGFKCKAKSDDWCQLAKMFEGMTKWNIWICYDVERDFFHAHVDKHNGYKPIDDEVLFIPEELGNIRQYAETVRSEVERLTEYSIVLAKKVQQMTCERRLQYEWVNTNHPTLMPAIMKSLDYLNGKTQYVRIRQAAHKLIKPESEE